MRERSIMAAGAVIAVLCCAAPLLAALGLGAWLANAGYVLTATLVLCIALVGFGLYRLTSRRDCR